MIADSEAGAAQNDGAAVRAHLRVGTATGNVTYSLNSASPRTVTLKSDAAVSITLQNATTANAEFANGYLVHRGALGAGGDAIIRPTHDGFEDYFYFGEKPAASTVEYLLALPTNSAGRRLRSNVLGVVDGNGAPLLNASPFVVDAAEPRTDAAPAVTGGAVDRSARTRRQIRILAGTYSLLDTTELQRLRLTSYIVCAVHYRAGEMSS